MSVRNGLLALLEQKPAHGYDLKRRFESDLREPLNIGQVYTTLGRLERDGLVRRDPSAEEERAVYEITERGRDELAAWFTVPVAVGGRGRDELALKVLVALDTPGVDAQAVIARQREATLDALRATMAYQAELDPSADLAVLAAADLLLERAAAELRWLDLTAARLGARPAAR